MTSSLQIEDYYKGNRLFGGVYSKDELANISPDGKCYIINMENSDEGNGSHWVCVIDCLKGCCVYADSFGVSPPPEICDFMRRSQNGDACIYSMCQYQEDRSDNCGRFCVWFIDSLLKTRRLVDMDRGLTEDPSRSNERKMDKIRL